MAVYLKSIIGGNKVTARSIQKHFRRKRRKIFENSSNSNPIQRIIMKNNFLKE